MSNKQPKSFKQETGTWATEIPTRQPQFKLHKTLGHAKCAITNHVPAQSWHGGGWAATWRTLERFTEDYTMDVYELVDGEWVHHPEFSVDPKVDYEFSVHPYVKNALHVKYNNAEPIYGEPLLHFRKKTT